MKPPMNMLDNSTIGKEPESTETTRDSFTRVAAIQMTAGPNIWGNLEEAARLLELAAAEGAKLAALPEYFCLMGMSDADKVAVREQANRGPIQEFLSKTAKRLGIWIVGGTVPLVSSRPDKVRNSCLVYDEKANRLRVTTKFICLAWNLAPRRYAEEETIEAGCGVVVVDHPLAVWVFPSVMICVFPSSTVPWAKWILFCPGSLYCDYRQGALGNVNSCPRDRKPRLCRRTRSGRVSCQWPGNHGDSMIVHPWGVILIAFHAGPA